MFTPDYQIKLSTGDSVPLLFNSWTFKTYAQRNGFELADLIDNYSKCFKIDYFDSLLLCAAESYCRFNAKEFTYTALDASLWMDEMGGVLGIATDLSVYKIAMSKLFGVPEEKLTVDYNQKDTGTKKKKKAA